MTAKAVLASSAVKTRIKTGQTPSLRRNAASFMLCPFMAEGHGPAGEKPSDVVIDSGGASRAHTVRLRPIDVAPNSAPSLKKYK